MTPISEISGAGGDEHNIKQSSSIGGDEQHDDGGYFRVMLSEIEDYKRLRDSDTDASILKKRVGISKVLSLFRRSSQVLRTRFNWGMKASIGGDKQQDDGGVPDSIDQRPSFLKHHGVSSDSVRKELLATLMKNSIDDLKRKSLMKTRCYERHDGCVFDSICQRTSSIELRGCISDTDPKLSDASSLKEYNQLCRSFLEDTGTQWNASTCGDEQQGDLGVSDSFSISPIYSLETLDDHINRFDTDPKILDELDKRVKSDKETQTIWFHELRNTWTNPQTPEDAFEHVLGVFYALYNGLPPLSEFQGFMKHYGLPTYCDLNLDFELEDAAVCDGVSDSTAGDIPTYKIEVLSDHIKRYDTEPEVLHELDNRVSEDREGQTFWFVGLRKAWTNPKTPEDASRLVRDVFYKLYNGCPPAFDLQGFLEHYGLPTYWELPEGRKLGFYSQRK